MTEAEISVTLLGDVAMADLHSRHLGVSAPTDVLSFALHDEGEPPLGDVYIGYETAEARAAELGIPITEELVRLAIHGVLHVLGHEHPEEGRYESPMFRRQEDLVRRVLSGEEAS